MQIPGFSKAGKFYKGNFHMHSTKSDGTLSPAETLEAYKSRGYDFVSLTDHFLDRDSLMKLVGRTEYEGVGEFITVTDTTALRTDDFTTILGAEYHGTGMSNGTPWHMVAVGLPLDFAPWDGKESIASITERAKNAGAFIGIAHPAASLVTMDDVKQVLPFADAIEVYNHAANLFSDGESWYFSDILLQGGNRLTTYAADDSHSGGAPTSVLYRDAPAYTENSTPEERARNSDAFGGWVHVKAESLDPDALLAAIKAGDFYSSTGPEIKDIAIEDNEIVVKTSPASGVRASGNGPTRFMKMAGAGPLIEEVRFPFTPEGYVRITVFGPDGTSAWSNPIWFS
ncbi:MAG TPA: hypothetical protein VFQ54_00450 [Thermomicrobiales bacterium]|nr:hypothetical protein [Thermomicrobiales bacterium]